MIYAISIIYSLLVFAAFIWAIVVFFSEKKRKKYVLYGVIVALVCLVIDVFSIVYNFGLYRTILPLSIFTMAVSFFRTIMFTGAGMILSSRAGLPGMPYLRNFLRKRKRVVFNTKELLRDSSLVLIAFVLYSVLLIIVTKPEVSSVMKQLQNNLEGLVSQEVNWSTYIFLIEVAIVEEVIFRFGIQNLLGSLFKRKNGYTIAIIITSLIWTIGHVGSLDPDWVKMLQIFPIGIALGFMYKKYGIEICMLLHALFNIVMAALVANGIVVI